MTLSMKEIIMLPWSHILSTQTQNLMVMKEGQKKSNREGDVRLTDPHGKIIKISLIEKRDKNILVAKE